MDNIEQMLVSWIASQSVLLQIAFSVALIFLIGPAALTIVAAAVTRLERMFERLLWRRAGVTLEDGAGFAETETESNTVPDNAIRDRLVSQASAHDNALDAVGHAVAH